MRRSVASALVAVLVVGAAAVTGAAPAAAARTTGSATLDEVLDAASANARCGLTRDKLAAIMLAPTFPETGAPTSRAPSPMTLSRWDNQTALYAFGSTTAYPRAFWHPGVGQWQFDEAGGWGMTAALRIDARTSAFKAADVMATRWCANPTLSYVWAPWFGCGTSTCTAIYNDIFDGTRLRNVNEESVTRLGGMQARTCVLGTSSAQLPCWYVDASAAEGYEGFARESFGQSPVAAPFYVFESGGEEIRHWATTDSGYPIAITAHLQQGLNSRTSLRWERDTAVCDITKGRGICDPIGLASSWRRIMAVSGTYRPFVGDFDGDGRDDLFLYAPGRDQDFIFFGRSGNSWAAHKVTVSGTYEPLVGDFDGDGRDDVYWYAPGLTADTIWYGQGDGSFATRWEPVNGTYEALVGDYDGDGRDDVLWYAAGGGGDYLSSGRAGRGFSRQAINVAGHYTPLVGDYDGDGRSDVFWYAPGDAPDTLWRGSTRGRFVSTSVPITNTFTVHVGDFDGNGRDDLFLYRPGTASDWLFTGQLDGTFGRVLNQINGAFVTVPGDFDGDGRDDLVLYRPGAGEDYVHRGRTSGVLTSSPVKIDGAFLPVVGDFNGKVGDDVFWYRPGIGHDAVWYAASS